MRWLPASGASIGARNWLSQVLTLDVLEGLRLSWGKRRELVRRVEEKLHLAQLARSPQAPRLLQSPDFGDALGELLHPAQL